ncbi:MAG: HEAT repeat domain-containing protein [Candidatus Omnitrophica bacterium]|nr:HEAT repeat domain-containing protein [Candidatus Omnitrophota bacterium]
MLNSVILIVFLSQQLVFAAGVSPLELGPALASHLQQISFTSSLTSFNPPILRFLNVERDNPYNYFNFLLDKGDSHLTTSNLNKEAEKLISYFKIGIALPNENFWVNLKPNEKESILPQDLERTDLGKVLLEADLRLKKDAARLLHPEHPQGKIFWSKIFQKLGNNAQVTTQNRLWIVPDKAEVWQTEDGVLVVESSLKVLLENEYLKKTPQDDTQAFAENLMKETILPELTKEVNTISAYAGLRQVYNALILAQWFKQQYQGKSAPLAANIGRGLTEDLISATPWSKEDIWQQYIRSLQQGEYKTKVAQGNIQIQYFSGGIDFATTPIVLTPVKDTTDISSSPLGDKLGTNGGFSFVEVGPELKTSSPLESFTGFGNKSEPDSWLFDLFDKKQPTAPLSEEQVIHWIRERQKKSFRVDRTDFSNQFLMGKAETQSLEILVNLVNHPDRNIQMAAVELLWDLQANPVFYSQQPFYKKYFLQALTRDTQKTNSLIDSLLSDLRNGDLNTLTVLVHIGSALELPDAVFKGIAGICAQEDAAKKVLDTISYASLLIPRLGPETQRTFLPVLKRGNEYMVNYLVRYIYAPLSRNSAIDVEVLNAILKQASAEIAPSLIQIITKQADFQALSPQSTDFLVRALKEQNEYAVWDSAAIAVGKLAQSYKEGGKQEELIRLKEKLIEEYTKAGTQEKNKWALALVEAGHSIDLGEKIISELRTAEIDITEAAERLREDRNTPFFFLKSLPQNASEDRALFWLAGQIETEISLCALSQDRNPAKSFFILRKGIESGASVGASGSPTAELKLHSHPRMDLVEDLIHQVEVVGSTADIEYALPEAFDEYIWAREKLWRTQKVTGTEAAKVKPGLWVFTHHDTGQVMEIADSDRLAQDNIIKDFLSKGGSFTIYVDYGRLGQYETTYEPGLTIHQAWERAIVESASSPVASPVLDEESMQYLRKDFVNNVRSIMQQIGVKPLLDTQGQYLFSAGSSVHKLFLEFFVWELEQLPFDNKVGVTLLGRQDSKEALARLISYLKTQSAGLENTKKWDAARAKDVDAIFAAGKSELFKNEIYPGTKIEDFAYNVDLENVFEKGQKKPAGKIKLERFFVTQEPFRVLTCGTITVNLVNGEILVDLIGKGPLVNNIHNDGKFTSSPLTAPQKTGVSSPVNKEKIKTHSIFNKIVLLASFFALPFMISGDNIKIPIPYLFFSKPNLKTLPLLSDKKVLEALGLNTYSWFDYNNSKSEKLSALEISLPAYPLQSSGQLEKFSQWQDILNIDLQENKLYQIFRHKSKPIFFFKFSDASMQGLAFDRLYFAVETETGLLSDEKLLEEAKRSNFKGGAGHDYKLADIANFYTLAEKEGIKLNIVEQRLKKELLGLKLLINNGDTYTASPENAAIVSCSVPQGGGFGAAINYQATIQHELNHAEYFTNPRYRQAARNLWLSLSESERQFVKAYFDLSYDITNEDLIIREFTATFRDKNDFLTNYLEPLGSQVIASKKGDDLYPLRPYFNSEGDLTEEALRTVDDLNKRVLSIEPAASSPLAAPQKMGTSSPVTQSSFKQFAKIALLSGLIFSFSPVSSIAGIIHKPAREIQSPPAITLTQPETAFDQENTAKVRKILIFSPLDAEQRAGLGIEDPVPYLINLLQNDPKDAVRINAIQTLGQIKDRRAISVLIKTLKDPQPAIRLYAAEALGEIGDPSAVEALIKSLNDPDDNSNVTVRAVKALGKIGDPRATGVLIEILKGPNRFSQEAAAEALGRIGGLEATAALITALKDPHPLVRGAAAEALGKVGDLMVVDHLIKILLEDPEPLVRAQAANGLGALALRVKDERQRNLFFQLGNRSNEILEGTMSPADIMRIWDNPAFAEKTASFAAANQFSVARAIELTLNRFGVKIDDRNIEITLPYVLKAREVYSQRNLGNSDTFLIVAAHEEGVFKPEEVTSLFQGFGLKQENIRTFKGTSEKANLRKAVSGLEFKEVLPRSVDIYLTGHGGEQHFWLAAGQVGQQDSDDLQNPIAYSYQELADDLLKLAQKYNGELSQVNIIVDACFSADFAVNTYNLLAKELKAGRIKSLPVMVTATNRGVVSYKGVFLKSLVSAAKYKKEFTLQVVYDAEQIASIGLELIPGRGTMFGQDIAIFLPLSGADFQALKNELGVKNIPRPQEKKIVSPTAEAAPEEPVVIPLGGKGAGAGNALSPSLPVIDARREYVEGETSASSPVVQDAAATKERLMISARMFFHGGNAYWNISGLLHTLFDDIHMLGYRAGEKEEFSQAMAPMEDFVRGYQELMEPFLEKASNKSDKELVSSYKKLWEMFIASEQGIEVLLAKERKTKLEEKYEERVLGRIKQKLLRLEQVLYFLLIRFPQQNLRHEESVDVAGILEEIHQKAAEAHIKGEPIPELSIRQDGESIIEGTDRFALQIALERFVSNGVHLGIKNIFVNLSKKGSQLEIAIEDNGQGIPKEVLERNTVDGRQKIFELGFSTRGTSGTGMALSYQIIRMLGGEIAADNSSQYGGASFVIKLPVKPISSAVTGDKSISSPLTAEVSEANGVPNVNSSPEDTREPQKPGTSSPVEQEIDKIIKLYQGKADSQEFKDALSRYGLDPVLVKAELMAIIKQAVKASLGQGVLTYFAEPGGQIDALSRPGLDFVVKILHPIFWPAYRAYFINRIQPGLAIAQGNLDNHFAATITIDNLEIKKSDGRNLIIPTAIIQEKLIPLDEYLRTLTSRAMGEAGGEEAFARLSAQERNRLPSYQEAGRVIQELKKRHLEVLQTGVWDEDIKIQNYGIDRNSQIKGFDVDKLSIVRLPHARIAAHYNDVIKSSLSVINNDFTAFFKPFTEQEISDNLNKAPESRQEINHIVTGLATEKIRAYLKEKITGPVSSSPMADDHSEQFWGALIRAYSRQLKITSQETMRRLDGETIMLVGTPSKDFPQKLSGQLPDSRIIVVDPRLKTRDEGKISYFGIPVQGIGDYDFEAKVDFIFSSGLFNPEFKPVIAGSSGDPEIYEHMLLAMKKTLKPEGIVLLSSVDRNLELEEAAGKVGLDMRNIDPKEKGSYIIRQSVAEGSSSPVEGTIAFAMWQKATAQLKEKFPDVYTTSVSSKYYQERRDTATAVFKFLGKVFEKAKEQPDTRIVFLRAGADPLYEAARYMSEVLGEQGFPAERMHSVWATMGNYDAIRKSPEQAAYFVKYLYDQGVFKDTQHILIVDTDSGYDFHGTDSLFGDTLLNSDAIKKANGIFNLNLKPFNTKEGISFEVFYMYFANKAFTYKNVPVSSYKDYDPQDQSGVSRYWSPVDRMPKLESVDPLFDRNTSTNKVYPVIKPSYAQKFTGDELKAFYYFEHTHFLANLLHVLGAEGYETRRAEENLINEFSSNITKLNDIAPEVIADKAAGEFPESESFASSPVEIEEHSVFTQIRGLTWSGRLDRLHDEIIKILGGETISTQRFSFTAEKFSKDKPLLVVDVGIGYDGGSVTKELALKLKEAGFKDITMVGVDSRPEYVKKANDSLKDPALEAKLEGIKLYFTHYDGSFDLSKVNINGKRLENIDVVLVSNVLGYYDIHQRVEAIKYLKAALNERGLLFVSNGPGRNDGAIQFMVYPRKGQAISQLLTKEGSPYFSRLPQRFRDPEESGVASSSSPLSKQDIAGIDFSSIQIKQMDLGKDAPANPVDRKIYFAQGMFKHGWDALAALYLKQAISLLKHNVTNDYQQKDLLMKLLTVLGQKEQLDEESIEFFREMKDTGSIPLA